MYVSSFSKHNLYINLKILWFYLGRWLLTGTEKTKCDFLSHAISLPLFLLTLPIRLKCFHNFTASQVIKSIQIWNKDWLTFTYRFSVEFSIFHIINVSPFRCGFANIVSPGSPKFSTTLGLSVFISSWLSVGKHCKALCVCKCLAHLLCQQMEIYRYVSFLLISSPIFIYLY